MQRGWIAEIWTFNVGFSFFQLFLALLAVICSCSPSVAGLARQVSKLDLTLTHALISDSQPASLHWEETKVRVVSRIGGLST